MKLLLAMLTSHIGMPVSVQDALLEIQFPANALGKKMEDGRVFGSLPHIKETWMEFLAAGNI